MEFKDYLTRKTNEAFRGGAGGAFGKQQQSSAFDFSKPYGDVNRDNNKFQDYNSRVNFGKSIEEKIINALRSEHGWDIKIPSVKADMYDKIDGYWKRDGALTPIQIKYRDADSRDDILAEVVKGWTPQMFMDNNIDYSGRDMIGRAVMYVVLNRSGNTIMVRNAGELKQIAKKLANFLMQQYNKNGQTYFTASDGSQARITKDNKTQVSKLMVYINPKSFEWKMDLPLKKSLWA